VSATNSVDEIWNGVALCENHHRAFDSHRLWVHPESREIKFHPQLLEHAKANERSHAFVSETFESLKAPVNPVDFPKVAMFAQRYEYYGGSYGWI
jgi:hypothetical protein